MALTPMMRQYLETKEKYKDCILFYRLGDFYEMFFDDAIIASKVLDLVLTGRDCGLEERAPMCGVPYHSAEAYIAKLLENGYKVAICEQLTTPDQSPELLVRDVVRVVTPGTVMEEGLLKEDVNNFIASVYLDKDDIGIAWADISTGEFYLKQIKRDTGFAKLCDTLLGFSPSEIICNAPMLDEIKELNAVKYNLLPAFSGYHEWAFFHDTAYKALTEQLQVNSLVPFECENKIYAICAAGALVQYLRDTQKRSLSHLSCLSFVKESRYMLLDNNAVRNLELVKTLRDGKKYGSLLWLLDETCTSMGARCLHASILQPLTQPDKIAERLDAVEELIRNVEMREGIREYLSQVRDLERLAAKTSYGSLNPKDCIHIKNTFAVLPYIRNLLKSAKSSLLRRICEEISCFDGIVDLLRRALNDNPPTVLRDGGIIKAGYNAELDELKSASSNGKRWLLELEAAERERTGIKNLRVGFNKVFGYYIEVTKSYLNQVPMNYVRKQTLANAERYITPELKNVENKILGADEASIRLEIKLFDDIVSEISKLIKPMQATGKALANLDMLLSFAAVAIKHNYCKPAITSGSCLVIEEGRHPVVEAVSKSEKFVPNDTYLDDDQNRIMIITGPNMAGKSTYMRQVALIILMAHIGSFVPAKKAQIPIVDRIFTRIGAFDNLAFDQSTFMVEMTEVASILHNATDRSLLVLDEVGRGTSTFDGLSIAWAVMEFISKKFKAKTLFATHYHELTELEGRIEGVKNYRILVKEINGSIAFLRKIQRGGANKSFGIDVAALAGIPRQVIERSRKILMQLEEADINNPRNKSAQVVMSFDVHGDRSSEYEEILDYVKSIDLDTLSPIEALNKMYYLKQKVAELEK